MELDLWQTLKSSTCPWKSRLDCSHTNLSSKVKLTSNQHLQPFPLLYVQVWLQRLYTHTDAEGERGERDQDRESQREKRDFSSPIVMFFHPCVFQSSASILLKSCFCVNLEETPLKTKCSAVIAAQAGRLKRFNSEEWKKKKIRLNRAWGKLFDSRGTIVLKMNIRAGSGADRCSGRVNWNKRHV